HDVATLPLGRLERAHLGLATPGQQQRLQRQQHRPELRSWSFDPLGHQRDTPLAPPEHLQDQAGFAPVVAVQDERGLIVDPFAHGQQRRSVGALDSAPGRPKLNPRPLGGLRTAAPALPAQGWTGRRGIDSGDAAACKARPAQRRSVGAASLITERAYTGLVVRPARAYLDPQLQKHLGVPQLFQLLARLGTDALELLALLADHHALVALALDD